MKISTKLNCLLGALVMFYTVDATADDGMVVKDMIVAAIDSVEVPAGQTGLVAVLKVREGQFVKVGDAIASTDDRQSRLRESVAATQVEIASRRVEDELASEQGKAELAAVSQAAKEHRVLQQVAERKAANDLRILASEKSSAVAQNELDRAMRSRAEFVESVSTSEIEGLRLAYEKSRLETRQAKVEQEIDRLNAAVEAEAAIGHELSIKTSKIALQKTQAEKEIERLTLELTRQQSELAELETRRHHVTSPLDGVVVQVHRKPGDWVIEGEPLVRVMRLSRLRAEGFAPLAQLDALRQNRSVSLSIHKGNDSSVERSGEIVFISPEVDPVNDEIRFWVEFENAELDVLPGMRLNLTLVPSRDQ